MTYLSFDGIICRQYLISPHNFSDIFAWGIGKTWGYNDNLSSFSCKGKYLSFELFSRAAK
jgi:hypothetical protein